MIYDYAKLRGKIAEVFRTKKAFAKAMGLSIASISMKLNGITPWSQKEMDLASDLLGFNLSEIPVYFFCKKG